MAEALGLNGSEVVDREHPRRRSRMRNMVLSDQEDDSESGAPYTVVDPVPASDPENITDDGDDANGKALAISHNDRPKNLQAVLGRRKGQSSQRNLSPLRAGGLTTTTAAGADSRSKISPRSRKQQMMTKFGVGPPANLQTRNKQRLNNASKKQFGSTQTPVSTSGRNEGNRSGDEMNEKQFGVVLPKVKKNTVQP